MMCAGKSINSTTRSSPYCPAPTAGSSERPDSRRTARARKATTVTPRTRRQRRPVAARRASRSSTTEPARIHDADQPLSAQERALRERLVPQRHAMSSSRCPTCGNEPVDAQTRYRQRQDLATIWLHLDGDRLHERRHCVACQPTPTALVIECDRCGDGPLVTGLPNGLKPEQWPPALTG